MKGEKKEKKEKEIWKAKNEDEKKEIHMTFPLLSFLSFSSLSTTYILFLRSQDNLPFILPLSEHPYLTCTSQYHFCRKGSEALSLRQNSLASSWVTGAPMYR